MNKYTELKTRQQKEFDALPLGFAFGNKQFAEMMERWGLDPETDTDKIYSIGYGGYVQRKDADLLHATTARHAAELEAAIEADKTGDGFIYEMFRTELNDHEYSYTMDLSDTLDALGYTAAAVMEDPRLKRGLEKACEAVLKSAA